MLAIVIASLFFNGCSESLSEVEPLESNLIDSVYQRYVDEYKSLSSSHPDSALSTLKKALADPGIDQSNESKYSITVYLAENYLRQQNYDSTLHYIHLIPESALNDFPKLEFRSFTLKGTLEYYRGNYLESIENHLKALATAEQNSMGINQARARNNLGIVYIKLEDWENAKNNMLKSLNLCDSLDIIQGKSYALGNLGIIYRNLEQFDLVLDTYKQSVNINLERNDAGALSRNYNNIGRFFESQNQLDSALVYYEKGLKLSLENGLTDGIHTGYHNMAGIYLSLGRYSEAEKLLLKAKQVAQAAGSKDTELYVLESFVRLHEMKGNYKEALDELREFQTLKDSIKGIDKMLAIEDLNIKYETEKAAKENLSLQNLNLIQQNQIHTQKSRIRVLGVLTFLLITIGLLGWIWMRNKSFREKQKALFRTSEESQLLERKRIAQDLHDGLGGTLAIIKNSLLGHKIKQVPLKTEDLDNVISRIDNASSELRDISHDLMPPELEKFGLESAIEAAIDSIPEGQLAVKFSMHNYIKAMSLQRELHVIRILKELIQNVMKHSQANSLNIQLTGHEKFLNIMVEDNGIGWDGEFGKSVGIGLKNVRTRINLLNGTINIDTGKDNGTTVNITCPYG